MSGLPRRRVWRWAVAVWAVAVAVGGLLTLWLQDSTEPRPPARWENADPSPSPSAGRYESTECPIPTPTPTDEPFYFACAVKVG